MTLNPLKSPAVFSLLCASVALIVAGTCPVWVTDSWVRHYVGSGPFRRPHRDTLWVTMENFPDEVELAGGGAGAIASLWSLHRGDLALLVAVLAVGGALGRAFYWLLWERRPVQQEEP